MRSKVVLTEEELRELWRTEDARVEKVEAERDALQARYDTLLLGWHRQCDRIAELERALAEATKGRA
jgi:hypothetical protein